MKPRSLPEFLSRYFWDVNFYKLDLNRYPAFVITRILEYGDEEGIRWMMKTYPRFEIVAALRKSRELTPQSANFWVLVLGVKRNRVKCLSKSFRKTRRQFWPY